MRRRPASSPGAAPAAALLLAVVCALPAPVLAGASSPSGLPLLAPPPPAQVVLGRRLFFDRQLSVNGTLSCAMCHVPEQGYTANELRTSVGMEGVSLRRNAPTLLNVAHHRTLFHDGRAASLEEQALMPLLHPDEMANPDLSTLAARAAAMPGYGALFRRAFGDPRVTGTRIASALAAFQRTLLAADSPFDRWRYGGDASAITADVRRGFEIFVARGCVRCHPVGDREALFTDHRFHNVGVGWRTEKRRRSTVHVSLAPGVSASLTAAEIARVGAPETADLGRYEVTRDPLDLRAIRTPTLRNVALTAPYMHDGSLDTLEQVLDHHAHGGSPDDPAQDPGIASLTLSDDDRRALLAFLHSLTSPQRPGQPVGLRGSRN